MNKLDCILVPLGVFFLPIIIFGLPEVANAFR